MSQAQRPKSEFLGLHDPYGDGPAGSLASQQRRAEPLLDKEKASELMRAGASLTVIIVLMAVVVTALF
jgi:hypothetical protein